MVPLPDPPRLIPTDRDASGAARREPREPLSLDRIVDTALKLLAEHGYEAVTMRRVAGALGTGAASLYAHVANRRELDQLLINRVVRGIELPAPDPARWQEQAKQVLRSMLAVLRAHPGVARATFAGIPLGEEPLRVVEGVLAILTVGGIPDQLAAWAADMFPMYVSAIAFEESVYAQAGVDDADIAAFVEQMRAYFAALPPERFPTVVALAGPLTAGTGDDRFEFGIDLLVSGLAAMAARTSA